MTLFSNFLKSWLTGPLDTLLFNNYLTISGLPVHPGRLHLDGTSCALQRHHHPASKNLGCLGGRPCCLRGIGSLSWQTVLLCYFFVTNPSEHIFLRTCVSPHTPTDGMGRIFSLLLCRDRELNSHWFSCTSLRDLNSGRFTDWATEAIMLLETRRLIKKIKFFPSQAQEPNLHSSNYSRFFLMVA